MNSQSVSDLKALRDKTNDIYTALLNLQRPVNQWEDLLIFLTVSKLDKVTRHDWEISLGDNVEIPNFAELDGFLTSRIRALEAIKPNSSFNSKSDTKRYDKTNVVRSHQVISNNGSCIACDGTHPTFRCKAFLGLTIDQRFELLKRHKGCFNCLRKGHTLMTCRSYNVCANCKRKHHTLLHRERAVSQNDNPSSSREVDSSPRRTPTIVLNESISGGDNAISSNNFVSQSFSNTILPTASVVIKGKSGHSMRIRALLDQGSQASFVTESVAQLIRADRRTMAVGVSGIGGVPAGTSKRVAFFTVEPCSQEGPVLPIRALVLPKLTAYVPKPFNWQRTEFFDSLELADSDVAEDKQIDLIIGSDYYGTTLRDGLRHGPNGDLTAQLTIFGWIISGPLPSTSSEARHNEVVVNHVLASETVDESLRRFWELEEIPQHPSLSDEDARCEAIFRSTHTRLPDGRYVIRLPFKSEQPIRIGETERDAKRIFVANESRIYKHCELADAYQQFLREYEDLNHMERVSHAELLKRPAVYLPHHAIIKTASQTTKVRVVFNASRPSSNGTSLNDHLLVGPKLQADLFALLIKWRAYKFVYSTDIEKMFRQILVHESDTDFQRIFWRDQMTSEIVAFRLLTVTYGTASAPFLANRVMKQLAADERRKFPLAASVLDNSVYVDDLMFGADDVDFLIQVREQLTQLLRAGGFRTHKWAANDLRLLENFSESERSLAIHKTLKEDSSLNVLGIAWHPASDTFKMQVSWNPVATFTKRTFLSLLARLFDPHGWVSPVTVNAKIILQLLWLRKVDWDEPLSGDLAFRCGEYQTQLLLLEDISLPRWTGQGSNAISIHIHGYSDASNAAYAAVVYLRVEFPNNSVKISLLYAKTKVAPLKVQSVPRLELCGALLLIRAFDFVRKSMKLAQVPAYCWTDSRVVLSWLSSVPTRWTPFVANRVSEILNIEPDAHWRYVPSASNPADCASRGISTETLKSHQLWWFGPSWLRCAETEWPICNVKPSTEQEERGRAFALIAQEQLCWNLPEEVSSWTKLLHVTAYVRRFVNNIRSSLTRISHIYLDPDEIIKARCFWVRSVQAFFFGKDIHALKIKSSTKLNSQLLSLSPVLDKDGVLRVGGYAMQRLQMKQSFR